MSYLRYLCLITYSGVTVQHILCCVFVLFSFFILCTIYCQFLWIVHFCLSLRYSLTFNQKYFNRLSYHFPASPIFSNRYLNKTGWKYFIYWSHASLLCCFLSSYLQNCFPSLSNLYHILQIYTTSDYRIFGRMTFRISEPSDQYNPQI